jgi:hypothetical protein
MNWKINGQETFFFTPIFENYKHKNTLWNYDSNWVSNPDSLKAEWGKLASILSKFFAIPQKENSPEP